MQEFKMEDLRNAVNEVYRRFQAKGIDEDQIGQMPVLVYDLINRYGGFANPVEGANLKSLIVSYDDEDEYEHARANPDPLDEAFVLVVMYQGGYAEGRRNAEDMAENGQFLY